MCQGCRPVSLYGYFAAGGRDVGIGPAIFATGNRIVMHTNAPAGLRLEYFLGALVKIYFICIFLLAIFSL